MIKVWYVGGEGQIQPEETTCEVPGYPHLDDQGRVMYVNTHFADLAAAWDRLLAERKAHLHLVTVSLRNAQEEARRLTEQTAEVACLLTEAQEKYRRQQGEEVEKR